MPNCVIVFVYLSVRPVFDLWDRKRDCLHYSVSGISLVVNSHNCCRHAYKHMDVGCQFLKVGSNQLNLFGPSSKRLLCSIGAACQWESIGSLLSLCVQVIYPEPSQVTGQNGIGQNGIGQNGMDKMVRTKWYNFIFCEHLKSVEFNIY